MREESNAGVRGVLTRRNFLKAGGGAGIALLAAGCGSQQSSQQQKSAGNKGIVNRSDISIAAVTHGPPSDPFWSVVKNGLDQASQDLGVDAKYRTPSSFNIPDIQRAMESAIATKPDGMAVSIVDTDALAPSVKKATDEGIPVVVLNAGRDVWQDVGALTYVGQTPYKAGLEAGKRMAQDGVKNAICLNHQQGNVTLDQRCSGFEEGLGGSVEQIAVDGSDPTKVENGLKTSLRQKSNVDGVLALGPAGANPALNIESLGGGDIKFATFDLSPEILKAIQNGKIEFAVDQQAFLQGYLPITFLTTYIQYLLSPVNEVLTGPSFVTKKEAGDVLALSRKGIR